MPSSSTIVATKRALVMALQTRPALNGVLISYADPGAKGRKEQVFIAEVRNADQEPVALRTGTRKRDEEYELDVYVDVLSKASAETSEERTMELVAELEEFLANDPKINNTPGVLWAVVTDMRMKTAETGDGPSTRCIVTVTVRGRLL